MPKIITVGLDPAKNVVQLHGVVPSERPEVCRLKAFRERVARAPGQPDWLRILNFYLRNGFDEVGPRLRRLI